MKTGLWNAFFRGWGIGLKNPSLVFMKWFFNLLAALLIVGPIFDLLSNQLDHSQLADSLLPRVDGLALEQLMLANRETLSSFATYWLPIAIIFLLLNIYLNGGILDAIQRERRPSWAHFFDACGHHFGSLLGVLLLAAMLSILLAAPLVWGAGRLLGYLEAWFPSERFTLSVQWGLMILLPLLAGTWLLRVYDYARILVCQPVGEEGLEAHSPWRTMAHFFRSIGFTCRFYGKTLLLWILFFLSQIALFPLFGLIKPHLEVGGPLGIYTELGAGQILILLRIVAGIALLAGQAKFLQGLLRADGAPQETKAKPETRVTSPVVAPSGSEDTVFLPASGAGDVSSPGEPVEDKPEPQTPIADRPVWDPRPPDSEDKSSS